VGKYTLPALGLARMADGTAVGHHEVREREPVLPRRLLHHIQLYLPLLLLPGEPKPAEETDVVGIYGDAFDDTVRRAEDDGRRLAADSPQREHLFHRTRHLATIRSDDGPAGLPDRFCLHAVGSAGMDVLLEFSLRNGQIVSGFSVLPEEIFRYNIHPLIRALRSEDGGNEEPQRRPPMERAVRIGILFFERTDHLLDSEFLCGHGGSMRTVLAFVKKITQRMTPRTGDVCAGEEIRYSRTPMPALPVFTVFDVETTGLDPYRGDKIIEIAGVRIENGVIQEEKAFVELVNPERAIPWEAKRINKIDDVDVAGAPTIDQVLPRFLEFAKDSLLVAHNAQFDMGFLEVEKEHCWGYIDLPECLCTMRLSQSVFPREFRHNLDVLAARLGLTMERARHRALPDVLLTSQALLKMAKMAQIQSIDELRKRAGLRSVTAA